jgi:hypothetical protein
MHSQSVEIEKLVNQNLLYSRILKEKQEQAEAKTRETEGRAQEAMAKVQEAREGGK